MRFKYLVLSFIVWTLLASASLYTMISLQKKQSINLAKTAAQANFQKDLAFRKWATAHGGIYVPIDNRTPPNPFLKHVAEQNIETPSGKKLTLMNPAYMLRQIMSEYSGLYGAKARVTSLNPLNPINRPDAWELNALKEFKNGGKEIFELVKNGENEEMRLMQPMIADKECLKCHAYQGYKEGDIRGGISVRIPMEKFYSLNDSTRKTFILAHVLGWIIGIVVITLFYSQQNRHAKKHKEHTKKLEELAHYDVLTSLPNRTMFMDYLEKAIEMAKRDNKQFAVLFLDLDNFKVINDSHGHTIGDDLLKKVAIRINEFKRDYDLFARIGGDEFLFLINDGNASNVASFAQRLLEIFHNSFDLDGNQVHISSSMGISFFPKDGSSSKELLQSADGAMYKAKDLGKNNYQLFTQELNDKIKHQMKMGELLREAMKNDEFVLHYQPKINSKTEEIVGMEALIRWQREDSMVMPIDFIWVAEESGFIKELGAWVIEEAVRQVKIWREKGFKDIYISVNVSAKQFNQKDFLEFISKSCVQEGAASCIEIELTESLLMHDVQKIQEKLEALRDMGINLSIDDFGTGYSSLSYLKRFPVQTIKIDKSFVDDIASDPNDLAISQSIIALARAMEMEVVAEGVETKEQLDVLSSIGCNIIQGYYYSKPVSAEEVEKFLY